MPQFPRTSGTYRKSSCIQCRFVLRHSRTPRWRGRPMGHSPSYHNGQVFEEEMDETKKAGYA